MSPSAHMVQVKYRPDIDGLRAIAILTVVAYHAGVPGVSGGFVGVDVFFVLSGFLITSLLYQELERTGRISIINFYARRVRRLLPALAATVLLTAVVACFVLIPDPELRWFAQSAISVAAGASNMFFLVKTGGYFDATSETQPLLHTWSLAVEEQFYVLWPLLLWLVVARSGHRSRRNVLVVIAAVSAASLVLALLLTPISQQASFYLMPTRLWELGVGAMLAVAGWRARSGSVSVVALLGLTLVVGSVFVLDGGSLFPGLGALPAVIGTTLLVLAGSSSNRISHGLSHPWLVWIGLRSYSWYLLHWPALTLVRVHTMEQNLWRDVGIAIATLIAADLSFRLVEQPFRYRASAGRIGAASPRQSVLAGVATLAAIAGLAAVVLLNTAAFSRVTMSDSLESALQEHRTVSSTCPNVPASDGDAVDCTFPAQGAHAANPEDESRTQGRIVLTGDSHALALLPAVQQIAEATGMQLDVMWDTGCPFLPGFTEGSGQRVVSEACRSENVYRVQELAAEPPTVLVISGRYSSYLQPGPGLSESQASLAAGLSDLAHELDRTTVAVIKDVPRFPHDVPLCLLRRTDCDMPRADAESDRRPQVEAFDSLSGLPNVLTWDPMEHLCTSQICRGQANDGTVLYRDRDHLSRAGALALAKALSLDIEKKI